VVTPIRRRVDHSEDDFSNIRFEYSDESLKWKSPMALKKRSHSEDENEALIDGGKLVHLVKLAEPKMRSLRRTFLSLDG
jgi:hypothetical protein